MRYIYLENDGPVWFLLTRYRFAHLLHTHTHTHTNNSVEKENFGSISKIKATARFFVRLKIHCSTLFDSVHERARVASFDCLFVCINDDPSHDKSIFQQFDSLIVSCYLSKSNFSVLPLLLLLFLQQLKPNYYDIFGFGIFDTI